MNRIGSTAMRWLHWSWWFLWPLFTAAVLAATPDRACGESKDVLAGWFAHSSVALTIGAVWIAAHIWIGAVLVVGSAQVERLEGTPTAVRSCWPGSFYKVVLMAMCLLIAYMPASLLRVAGALASCRP